MRRFILAVAGIAAIAIAAPVPATAQVSASRLYKLCLMEDPDCLLTLHTVYALALAKLANIPERVGPMCRPHHAGRTVPDDELFYYYMNALQTDLQNGHNYLSRMSAIEAMMVTIDPCSHPTLTR
jgi:hypothetical protein